MTERQKRFCDEYLKKLKIGEAAKAVGYTASAGYKIIQRPEIKEYIKRQSAKISEEINTGTIHIYDTVKSIMEDQSASNKDRLKAAELLGRLKNAENQEVYKNPVIIMGENYIKD